MSAALTRATQKAFERRIANAYVKARGLSGELFDGPEPPDFVLRTKTGNRIGIEVTEYNQPQRTPQGYTKRQVEAQWSDIRKHVVQYRESCRDLDNLSVRINFIRPHLPSTKEVPAFVNAVAALIRSNLSQLSERHRDFYPTSKCPDIVRSYIRTITVRRVNSYLEWNWNYDIGGVGTSDAELLSLLKRKSGFVVNRKNLERLVLVVKGEGITFSQIMAPIQPTNLIVLRNPTEH